MTTEQKLREALRKAKAALSLALSDVDWRKDSLTQPVIHKAYNCAHEALALPTADHLPDAGKMVNGLTKAETDASASVSGLTAEHRALKGIPCPTCSGRGDLGSPLEATAAPVGEREAFERTMMDKFGWQRTDFKLDDFGYFDGHTDTAWMAWQARVALSAGDAVLAEREACAKLCEEVADDLITAMRKEGETDDEVMTSLVASVRVCAEEIRGGYSKKFNPHNAAIDAAMRKDKL